MIEPYYQDDVVTLYHGDCREVDEWQAADMLVCDPPYGIRWAQASYSFKQGGRPYITKQHAGIDGDEDTTVVDYVMDAFGDKPQAVFGSPLLPPPAGTRQVLVWKKAANSGLWGTVAGFRRDIEMIYLVGKWPQQAPRSSAVLEAPGSVSAAALMGHPHAKPLRVLLQLLEAGPRGIVADPFAGSGSTLFAARQLGRKAIGVEIEERYCEVAAKRLSQQPFDFGDWTA